MKLSNQTIGVLKSFTNINTAIFLRPGKTIRSLSPQENILGEAVIDEDIDQEFGIYDLPKFLAGVRFLDNPNIEFSDKYATLTSGNNEIRFVMAEPGTVEEASPEEGIELPSKDVEFDLSESDFSYIVKSANQLNLPHISIRGDGANLKIVAEDRYIKTSNQTSHFIKESDIVCHVVFDTATFCLMGADYHVSISKDLIAEFKSQDKGLTYWLAANENYSSFQG